VSIGSPDMGTMQDVTDVTRSGETLVLSYEADAQGQFIPVTIRLEPAPDFVFNQSLPDVFDG
jgi:hypothetical protein